MTTLLLTHLLAIGAWLGCYLVESILEYQGVKNPEIEIVAIKLHRLIDIFVEIPIFIIVLGTGFLLLSQSSFSLLLMFKVIFGLVAVGINIVCAFSVFRRKAALDMQQTDKVHKESKFIHSTFLGVIPGLITLALGVALIQ